MCAARGCPPASPLPPCPLPAAPLRSQLALTHTPTLAAGLRTLARAAFFLGNIPNVTDIVPVYGFNGDSELVITVNFRLTFPGSPPTATSAAEAMTLESEDLLSACRRGEAPACPPPPRPS